jgi:hypothetical protein
MDESYVLEVYPHGCGVRLYSLVEHLTSLEDHLFTVALIYSLPLLGEYIVLYSVYQIPLLNHRSGRSNRSGRKKRALKRMNGLGNIGLLYGCSRVILRHGADDSPCIWPCADKMKSHCIKVGKETLRRHIYA